MRFTIAREKLQEGLSAVAASVPAKGGRSEVEPEGCPERQGRPRFRWRWTTGTGDDRARVTPGSRATLYHGRAENPFKIKDPDNLKRVLPRLINGLEVRA